MEDDKTIQQEEEINFGEYFSILGKVWWKVLLLSLAVGVATFVLMFRQPNIYQATAVIAPAIDEKRPIPSLGALASFGIEVGGGASKVEDLETLFKSNDLTVRVFRKYNLWPIVLKDKFDASTGNMKITWTDRLFGYGREPKIPGDWDAIRAVRACLKVSTNRKNGTVVLSFESPSSDGSANIVRYYLDEGKSRLQDEALDRATKNKKFIEEQIGKTVDALTRDRLYSLYGQEVEREMMARNRDQFGFRVIDAPRTPDRKSGPQRLKTTVLTTLFSSIIWVLILGYKAKKNQIG